MNNVIKLFEWLKKLLLWITKALYILITVFSFYLFLFHLLPNSSIGNGRISFYGESLVVTFVSSILAFSLWLLHIWIKNTKYIGFIMALTFYWVIWTYVPFLHSVLEGTSQAFINFIKHLF